MPRVSDQHKEDRMKLILKAAEAVFKRKGYELTTVQDILDEAKVSKGGFYFYFNGKDEVFSQLEKQFDLKLFDPDQIQQSKKHPVEELEGVFQGVVHIIDNLHETIYPILFEYYLESYRNAERRNSLEQRYERSLEEIASIIDRGIEQGVFQPRLASTAIARVMITYLDGLVCDAMQLGKEKIQFAEQVLIIKQMIKDLLKSGDDKC